MQKYAQDAKKKYAKFLQKICRICKNMPNKYAKICKNNAENMKK